MFKYNPYTFALHEHGIENQQRLTYGERDMSLFKEPT